ncbi:MAG TPA: hypothetical protein VE621_14980, partial [Bryobacteraceae bacterium]|nr:hypothetical protein [Bryobacteraceae bacterium]
MRNTLLTPRAVQVLVAAAFAVPLMAQTSIIPLNTLVANHGSISAGNVNFSNFQKPGVLPSPVALLGEFGDIGVSATANADGTVSLAFIGIDPASGLPNPLIVSSTAGADLVRLISYSITVTDPALRLHSVDQNFGPGTVITGNNTAINGLYTAELPPDVYDLLIFDQVDLGSAGPLRGTGMPSADGSGTFAGTGGILLPGGNLAGYTMANEFGLIKGHWGFAPGGSIDSVTVRFSLVPAGSPVPPATVNLAAPGDVSGVSGSAITGNGFNLNSNGIGSITLSNYAQEGGAVITLTSSNPAAIAVPPTITVPQGYYLSAPFVLGAPTVDAPTQVTISASFNGRTQTQVFTANPVTPLAIAGISATVLPANTIRILINMNRVNESPATVLLTSSNPGVAAVPASFTIPAFTAPGDFRFASLTIPYAPTGVDTPVTISALFGGVTTTATVVIPRTVDTVNITRAELVVRTGSLRVDATSNSPS